MFLVNTLSFRNASNGSTYATGTLQLPIDHPLGEQVPNRVTFKCWGTSPEEFPVSEGEVLDGEVTLNHYNGEPQLIVRNPQKIEGVSPLAFLPPDLDNDKRWSALCQLLQGLLSPEGYSLFTDLISPLESRFREEFAAKSHHDAHLGGLMWHSFKVTVYLSQMIRFNPVILTQVNADVLFLGSILHDIGKIHEYSYGAMTDNSYVGHRIWGILFLKENEDRITSVPTIGAEGLDRLYTIMNQHHGEFEERPRTVEALLVHLADSYDAYTTAIAEGIPSLRDHSIPIRLNSFIVR